MIYGVPTAQAILLALAVACLAADLASLFRPRKHPEPPKR